MTADFTPGSRLGDYVLDAYVGAGSFGVVWRGHAEPGGETVAIKLLTGALSAGNSASMRGDVEVLAATAASSSPNVVRVLGGGSQPVPYIVMEYVQGTDLAAMLQTETRLTPARTIDVGLAIAGALQVLNQARIVHRDIKPANVLVDTHGVIKLTDFGVAKIVGYETITMTGQVAMTMAYAAPEVWEDDDDGDLRFGRPSHRSDLYALGILLYQCLCGVTPFRGNYGVLYRAHRERAPDLSTLPLETPASLREAIRRCLEKRQQDRPVDAAETYLMLQRASVELAEAQGTAPKDEPARFGPWFRVAPHPTLPWAWRCRHETSGAEATVEVYFADDTDIGEELRRVTKANAKLAPLGAEKIIESNRLLMRPQESWTSPPPGEFQFWVAREDGHPQAAKSISARTLQRGVIALDALIEAAARERIGLSLRDNLTLTAAGEIYVTRVGLAPGSEYLLEQAMAVLRALPLDADARAFITPASDFANLVARTATALETDDEPASTDPVEARAPDSTELVCRSCHEPLKPGELICGNCGHYQVRGAATVMVDGSQSAATRLSHPTELASSAATATGSGAGVQARLQDLGGGEYELVLTNFGARAQSLQLNASSKDDRLRVELPREVTVAPASTERVKVSVSAKTERRFGGKKRYQFTLVASGAGGIGEPPLTIEGSFEDQPSIWPMFAAATAGALLVALIAVVSAVLLTSGSSKASQSAGSPSTTAKPAEAAATAVPAAAPPPAEAAPTGDASQSTAAPAGISPVAPAQADNVAGAPVPPFVPPSNPAALPAPRVLPTIAPSSSTRVCPTAPPTNDVEQFKGCRVYEAVMDGSSGSFVPPRTIGACSGHPSDATGSDVRFAPGALELSITKQWGSTRISLNTPARVAYVLEFDITFTPGSENEILTGLRGNGTQGILWYIDVRSESTYLALNSENPHSWVELTPHSSIPGLKTGRTVTVSAAASADRYTLFVDGRLVLDYRDARLTSAQKPGINTQACAGVAGIGTVHILGARVYELAGQ